MAEASDVTDRTRHDLWVFAYGSLMWQPGFPFEEAVRARVVGRRRAFCIYSVLYRGTPSRPGLVLGLDRGGQCEGVAFRVSQVHAASALAYLRDREQVTGVYAEARVAVTLDQPGRPEIFAVTYLAERSHPGYAGKLSLAEQARLIRGARGRSGTNIDYLFNTLRHLAELGIRDKDLERLAVVVGGLVRRGSQQHTSLARPAPLTRSWAARPVRARRVRADRRKRFIYRQSLGLRLEE